MLKPPAILDRAMYRLLLLLLGMVPVAALLGAADSTAPIRVVWGSVWDSDSTFQPGTKITVSFPDAMVVENEVGLHNVKSPIRWSPELAGEWTWKSPTEGWFQVGSKVLPATRYEIHLIRGLKTLSGARVEASKPVDSRNSAQFEVTADYARNVLDKRPGVILGFSYPVLPRQVAEVVAYQDRDTRKSYPVEVDLLETGSAETHRQTKRLLVLPREDLPLNRTFDLIVENVREAETGTRLPALMVFPLGKTEPLKVEKVWTSNVALEKPRIHIAFNERVDVSEARKIRFDPPVEGLFFTADTDSVIAEGPFDRKTRYRVEIPASVVGGRGFSMLADSVWGAPFHPKIGAVLFPEDALRNAMIFRRSTAGFSLPLVQVNTGELHWRLASVPPEKVAAVSKRRLEFEEQRTDPISKEALFDPDSGLPLKKRTELLIDSAHLQVIAEGTFPESFQDEDVAREIQWVPAGAPHPGVCLLEVSGTNAKGETIGNRALLNFTDLSVLQKDDGHQLVLRIVQIGDGSPLAGAQVRAVSDRNQWIAEGTTDVSGRVRFPKQSLFPRSQEGKPRVASFLIQTPSGTVREALHVGFVYGYRPFVRAEPDSGENAEPRDYRGTLIPDRPLYRPGQVVHFKGFVRTIENHGSALRVPAIQSVQWRIEDSKEQEGAVHSAVTQTDAFGGFEGEWKIPENLRVGEYHIHAHLSANPAHAFEAAIQVQEFRPPPFTVDLQKLEKQGSVAGLHIQSQLFHGAPNAGAKVRWTALWKEIIRGYDSEETPLEEARAEGEGTLDAHGALDLEVPHPFTDQRKRSWFRVAWSVDVLGLDGQTITEPAVTKVHGSPVLLKAEAVTAGNKTVRARVQAWDADGVQAQDVPVVVEITREFQKSVREEIAPHVFRTVHASSREKVSTLSGVTGVPQTVPVPGPGMYHITARARDDETVAPVSASTVVHGTETDAQGEFWQTDPRNFSLQSDQQTYRAGETAVLTASAPFSGKVWVSVECDSVVLDGFPADLVHNAGRLEVPIKEGYFPNVWVHVFLLKPGGPTGLPAECVGSLELKVQRPESELEVVAALASQEVEPGRMVSGTLAIRCNNAPVPDADVTLYAVDDALLVAGGWHAPSLNAALYTPRPWGVHSATSNLWRLAEGLKKGGQMQKGFIVGGGGEDETTGPRKSVRKNFLPLAHWQTGLRSDAGGKLAFAFPAPDSLTRYRIVALAQTRDSAFGVGQETVEVSKKIQIEPALPRFVRSGDELEIRVLVRQKLAERLSVTLRCSGSLVFTGGTSQTQEVRREEPGVFRFHAKADGGTSASLAFSTEAGSGDAVEMNFPIHPPTLLRRESVFAAVRSGSVESAVAEAIPERWSRATGHASVSMSTSAWLPSIAALPRILEYPHGCTEQISSRILGYTVLGDLIEYLADDGERDRNYRTRVSAGLERLSAILLPDGSLPYWPGGPASHFGTVIGFWAAHEAMAKDWSVPEKFHERLQQRVSEMALGKDSTVSGFMRCFAVAVLSLCGAEERTLEPVIRDLYAKRKDFSSEARAFLAVAMFQFGVLEPQREQLLQEIDRPPASADFDHYAFSSPCREEAVRAWAFATIHPDQKVGHSQLKTWERVLKLLESSESLSTQENFWLLMAFRALHSHMQEGTAGFGELHPRPDAISRNRRTVAWNPMPIANLRDFSAKLPVPAAATLHALWKAEYRMDTTADDVRMDRGLRLERVVVNRTDAARNGTPEAPFKLGDELEITFRLLSPKLHHYVALEADLPGCFEALNPQIASVGKSLPPVAEGAENPLLLSFSELRDKVACLYMDRVDRGLGVVSTRVRVTSAGTFIWPPTQVAPMYDTRFSGLSAGSTCHVVE